jgi:hypothetical protein
MDPLSQLRDIHYPEPVSWWPPAPGWWVAGLLLLVLVAYATYRFIRYRQSNQYRRSAEQAIEEAHRRFREDNKALEFCQALNSILKRTALAYYPERDFAGLSGERWLLFLDSCVGDTVFSQGPGKVLATAPYHTQADIDSDQLARLCIRWARKHQ